MAKENKKAEKMNNKEMTLEEAKAFRASLAKPQEKKMTEQEKREAFRIFWTQEKKKYGKAKDLESILWTHLQAVKMDQPEKFEAGLAHFGLKKIGN